MSTMGDKDALRIQQEINTNMSVASQQPFAISNEEQAFNVQQQVRGAFNRNSRRKPDQQKLEQQRDTQEWVNKSNVSSIAEIGNTGNAVVTQAWTNNVNKQKVMSCMQRNNRASSESIETISENIKNSKESLKRRSCESLTIEEASMRGTKTHSGSQGKNNSRTVENSYGNENSIKTITATEGVISRRTFNDRQTEESNRQGHENANNENGKRSVEKNESVSDRQSKDCDVSIPNINSSRDRTESKDSLNESTYDLSRSYNRSFSINDPYTAAIDLSNKCRQFYFNHMKAAEAIKQSVRSAKHTRAKEKMDGKPSSGIDNAMDRLRSEMADLMDQDLSLMSQLLKLNDKIEEVKTHVAYRQRQETYSSQSTCYLSNSEMSDSEFEDNDDSRIDLSESIRNFRPQDLKTVQEAKPQNEIVLRRLEPTDSQIIIYKKKKVRKTKRRGSQSKLNPSRSDTEQGTTDESDVSDEGSDSLSDTESTLSNNSGSTLNGSIKSDDVEQNADVTDSGIQSPKQSEDPPKPKKGGISQNRQFLSFHKKNGNFTKSILTGLNVITMQGHNVPLDKYYVPPGLVYLKQEKSENVFCQFTK